MRLTIRLLGCEVLHVSTEPDAADDGRGDCITTPVSFGFVRPWEADPTRTDNEEETPC